MMPLNFIAPLGIVQDHTDPSLGAIDWSLAAAFHSPANASAGCAQIRALRAELLAIAGEAESFAWSASGGLL